MASVHHIPVITQLIQAVNDWSLVLESGNSDLRKAFDCVPDGRLLTKLQSYGVTGKLLDWIEDFLTDS